MSPRPPPRPRLAILPLLLAEADAPSCPTEEEDCCAPPPEEPCDELARLSLADGPPRYWRPGVVDALLTPEVLGDDLDELDDGRLAWTLDADAAATRGQRSIPEDPLAYLSGLDPSPVAEALQQDDRVPLRWRLADGHVVLLNLGDAPVEASCPGGTELLTGETCAAGEPRQLPAGGGEIWRP